MLIKDYSRLAWNHDILVHLHVIHPQISANFLKNNTLKTLYNSVNKEQITIYRILKAKYNAFSVQVLLNNITNFEMIFPANYLFNLYELRM